MRNYANIVLSSLSRLYCRLRNLTESHLAARGLYHRSGISPCPEDYYSITFTISRVSMIVNHLTRRIRQAVWVGLYKFGIAPSSIPKTAANKSTVQNPRSHFTSLRRVSLRDTKTRYGMQRKEGSLCRNSSRGCPCFY